MRYHNVLASLLAVASAASLHAQLRSREVRDFDPGWKFSQGDLTGADQPAFSDQSWQAVSLPHDWSIAGPVDKANPSGQGGGFFPNGIGWYRKSFTVTPADLHRRLYIVFDGVMANSDVWINGFHLGKRPNGYVSFFYDLTGHLNADPKAPNILAVRCDNAQQPASRWYEGAGIYRHVRLITTSDVHLAPWSLFVSTPKATAAVAMVHVVAEVRNDSAAPASPAMEINLIGPDGKSAGTGTLPAQPIAPGASVKFSADIPVMNPALWDLQHPTLYRATARVLAANNAKSSALDDDTTTFGIRDFHFDPNQGFFLNGRNFKVKGAAIHMDGGAFGDAVPAAVYQRRLLALRALGVNAIRTAHNPPTPEFLDLCDRLGFLVMDEMFDQWTIAKNPYDYHLFFNEWHLRDTADTVMRDRNHPSIILWSAGNEIHDTPNETLAKEILTGLVATFHQYDPTRPVTQALFRPNVSHDYTNGLADLLDVVGQNYRENEILAAHEQKPTRKIIGTENTHDRASWLALRDHPAYSGQFLWAGIDYLGESGGWPRIFSSSGLLDHTAAPVARGFERQSWWSLAPSVYITRRVAPAQRSPTDPGYESAAAMAAQGMAAPPAARAAAPLAAQAGSAAAAAANPPANPRRPAQTLFLDWTPADLAPHTETVEVYTNATEVDLQLNGKSLGRQKLHADASPLSWQVPFAPGTLTAVAYGGGKEVARDELRTAGKPTRLRLTADGDTLAAGTEHVQFFTANIVDAAGIVVPSASDQLHFTLTGAAGADTRLLTDSGSVADHDPFPSPDRHAFQGRAVAMLQSRTPGAYTLTVTSPNLTSATLPIRIVGSVPATPTHTF